MNSRGKETVFSRLTKKKTALFSLIFLSGLFVSSLFAFSIILDKTPNSNNQQLEISLQRPGFKTEILLKEKPISDKVSWFSKLMFGAPAKFDEIPFKKLVKLKNELEIITHTNKRRIVQEDKSQIITRTYFLGTDKYGRDIMSRLILGIRISLIIGFMAVIISIVLGIFIGAIGAYFGGTVDKLVMYLINITWSIPTLLLVFAIVIAFGRGFYIIFLAVGLTLWVDVARLVRGQVLKIKEEEFITAARSLSYSPYRVISKHIIPNIIGPLLVIAATNFAIAILIEAGLSYLGFGIQPPAPSVGNMLNENYGYAISGKPFLAMIPAITIMLMVLAFNLIGSGLRDILDVKSID